MAQSSWGDTIRAIVGFLATGVILALFYEPVRSWGLLAIAAGIVLVCVATARDRRGVVYGIVAIIASRLILALALGVLRYYYRIPHR